MSTRVRLYAAVALFAVAVGLMAAGFPLPASACVYGVMFLAGQHRAARRADGLLRRIERLTADRDRAVGQVYALSEERRHRWNHHLDARSGDHLRPDWAGVNAQTSTTRATTGAHTTTPA